MDFHELTFGMELRRLAVEMRKVARDDYKRKNSSDFAPAEIMDDWDREYTISTFVIRAYLEITSALDSIKEHEAAESNARLNKRLGL